MIASVTKSKSFHDRMNAVPAIPRPAKAKPMSRAAGTASSAHHDETSPSASITPTKQTE